MSTKSKSIVSTIGRGLSRTVSFRKKDKEQQQQKKSRRGLTKNGSFDDSMRDLFYPSTSTSESFRKKGKEEQKKSKRGLTKCASFDDSDASMRDLLHPTKRTEIPKESNHSELTDSTATVDSDWSDLSHDLLSYNTPGEYRTVSQVDFLTDCMAEEAMCIVHFYDANSNQHQPIDSVLEDMAKTVQGCKFYRLDSAKGLRISSRFNIKSTPTLLAIRDKKVLDRTSDFGDTSSFQATELRSWVTAFL
jgi:hypothetical protein